MKPVFQNKFGSQGNCSSACLASLFEMGMNPHKFINQYGLKKAKLILDVKLCDANFYSEKTGSYYATDKNDSVNLTQLSRAIDEYKQLLKARQAYETRERHWIAAVNKE